MMLFKSIEYLIVKSPLMKINDNKIWQQNCLWNLNIPGSLMGEKYIYVKVRLNTCNKYVVYILSFSTT